MKNQTLKLTNKITFLLSLFFLLFIFSCDKEDFDQTKIEPNNTTVVSSDPSSVISKDETLGSREIILNIHNNTPYKMTDPSPWFDSGRLKEGYTFKKEILPTKIAVTRMKEVESFELIYECSGYVNYSLNGGTVTIAYSNPDMGKNKVGIGTGGKTVWDNMESHEYFTHFDSYFTINGIDFKGSLFCTGGGINSVIVDISVVE